MDSPTILVVEDNEDDVFALKRVLKAANVANPLRVLGDGDEAIEYLQGTGRYSDRAAHPLPLIVFLDLILPRCDGFEVLAWIRQQPNLKSIPVVVLTGLRSYSDHQRAYSAGARSYLVKPPSVDDIRQLFDSMLPFWRRSYGGDPVAKMIA